MSIRSRAASIFRGAIGRKRMEQDMAAELQFHLAKYTEDLVRSGVSREQAERQARIEFGHIEPLKEECRQALGLRLWDETIQDLHYAGRMLRKNAGFALVAVLTLALGIGANTAIFSVVNAFVLKPLPYAHPGQLVAIWSADKKGPFGVSAADLYDWRKDSPVFEAICAWTSPAFTLQQRDDPEQVIGGRVNAEFFKMLGVTPQFGRDFLPEEDRPGAEPVAVLSDELWQGHFASDPNLVGKTIQIDGRSVTVVGIAPAGFHLPLMGKAMLWMPLALSQEERMNRRGPSMEVIARMKPGVTMAGATNFLKVLARRLETSYPATNAGRTVELHTLSDEIGREGARDPALIVFWLVGCVLLIACGNVANLIVGRAVGRRKEMAVRLAIGAGRGRLLRQLLTENLVLFLMAAALSVLFAMWGVNWIGESIPPEIRAYLPNFGVLRVDAVALIYTLGIALVAGLLFGFAPAFHCWRIDVNQGLKDSALRHSYGGGASRLKSSLIVLETALALVVLVVSGLLVKGLVKMYGTETGFQPNGLVTARVILSDAKYKEPKRAGIFTNGVLEQLQLLPGVLAVAVGTFIPYSGNNSAAYYAIEGRPTPAPADLPRMLFDVVSPEYFGTMGIPLLRGRAFTDQDRAESLPVTIINQTMAQRNWPGEDPVGKRLRWSAKLDKTLTIVGIVKDTKGLNDVDIPQPEAFLPYTQYLTRSLEFVIRTGNGSSDVAAGVRNAVKAADKGQAVLRIQTMGQLMEERRAQYSIVGQVTSFFAALSLFLAALGIYGVMAYSVAARKQEFGIRLALGAGRKELVALVVQQGLKLALAGLFTGLMGAFAVTRLMSTILYQVSPTDVPTFATISMLLLVVAALACYVPARRASVIEPTHALRYE